MNDDRKEENSEKKPKEEEKKEDPQEDGSENKQSNVDNRQSNVDTFLPPCELETMFVKGLLMPKNDLPKITSTLIPPMEMELTELRVKVVCLEKSNQAFKLELKCAELQVEAKEKVDKQKSRLIELLDAKVASLEKKNNTLIDMVEGLIKEKETRSTRLIDATKNMEMLSNRLSNSERLQRELKSTNEELKTMLNNVESKGSAIAKLAKEKLIKYKDENIRIQGELNDMKQIPDNSVDFDQNWDQLSNLGKELQEKLAETKTSGVSDTTAQILVSVGNIQSQICDKLAEIKLGTSAIVCKLAASNEKLVTETNQLKQSISDLQILSDKTQTDAPDSQLVTIKNATSGMRDSGSSDIS